LPRSLRYKEVYGGGVLVPCISNLGARGRWVDSFTLWTL